MLELIKGILIFMNIFNSFCLQGGIIDLPFTKEVPDLTNKSPEDILRKELQENRIVTEIKVGTEPQKIPMLIDLFYYDFYIAGKSEESAKSTSIKFDQSNSDTFYQKEKFADFGGRGFNIGYKASDIFLNSDNNQKYNLSFILAMDPDEGHSGMIGLKISSQEDEEIIEYNFINQLKKANAIKNYYFTIKYTDDTHGNLIIGDLPENYDNKFSGIEYKDTYVINPDDPSSWNMRIDSIYTKLENNKDKTDLGNTDIYFRLNLAMTIGTQEYLEELKKSFMDEQINNGVCFELKSSYYYTYYCKKNVNFKKMKNLYFYNKELDYNFEFTYKDLFFYNELDKNYYFLIKFETSHSNRWLIGEFFFKKYQLVFNQEKRKIGIYTGNLDNNKTLNQSWLSSNKWYLILIIFLVILLIVISVLAYLYIKSISKRKKKANELDDDEYEYTINK